LQSCGTMQGLIQVLAVIRTAVHTELVYSQSDTIVHSKLSFAFFSIIKHNTLIPYNHVA
jgi:hypothetical protein